MAARWKVAGTKKFAGFKRYGPASEKMKMSKAEFDKMYNQFYDRDAPRSGGLRKTAHRRRMYLGPSGGIACQHQLARFRGFRIPAAVEAAIQLGLPLGPGELLTASARAALLQ